MAAAATAAAAATTKKKERKRKISHNGMENGVCFLVLLTLRHPVFHGKTGEIEATRKQLPFKKNEKNKNKKSKSKKNEEMEKKKFAKRQNNQRGSSEAVTPPLCFLNFLIR